MTLPELKGSELYIPPLTFPGKKSFLSGETIVHPSGALPETRVILGTMSIYRHVPIRGTDVVTFTPVVSTEFYFCPALVVRGSYIPNRGLAHVVNGDDPTEYIEALRSNGMLGKLEGLLVHCPFDVKRTENFKQLCSRAGLTIMEVIEIPMKDEHCAPQTDVVLNPFKKEVRVVSEGRGVQTMKF